MSILSRPRFITLAVLLVVLFTYAPYAGAGVEFKEQKDIPRITAFELKDAMARGEKLFILDLRVGKSYDNSHLRIKGDIRVQYEKLAAWATTLPKDSSIVTYCT